MIATPRLIRTVSIPLMSGATTLSFHSMTFPKFSLISPSRYSEDFKSENNWESRISDLVGKQPQFKQVPPHSSFIQVTIVAFSIVNPSLGIVIALAIENPFYPSNSLTPLIISLSSGMTKFSNWGAKGTGVFAAPILLIGASRS